MQVPETPRTSLSQSILREIVVGAGLRSGISAAGPKSRLATETVSRHR
jgi:hypothetical protein